MWTVCVVLMYSKLIRVDMTECFGWTSAGSERLSSPEWDQACYFANGDRYQSPNQNEIINAKWNPPIDTKQAPTDASQNSCPIVYEPRELIIPS